MKPLPPDPPVYTPPPERWFDQHRHEGSGLAATNKTLTAMWLTLLDRMRLPLPTKPKTFSTVEREGFDKTLRVCGDDLMEVWRDACNNAEQGFDPENEFKRFLFGGRC